MLRNVPLNRYQSWCIPVCVGDILEVPVTIPRTTDTLRWDALNVLSLGKDFQYYSREHAEASSLDQRQTGRGVSYGGDVTKRIETLFGPILKLLREQVETVLLASLQKRVERSFVLEAVQPGWRYFSDIAYGLGIIVVSKEDRRHSIIRRVKWGSSEVIELAVPVVIQVGDIVVIENYGVFSYAWPLASK